MALTLYQYNLLDEVQKGGLLFAEGEFLLERLEGEKCVMLYQLFSFYLEVYYDGQRNQIERLRSFSSTEQLKPYLDKIDISPLLP